MDEDEEETEVPLQSPVQKGPHLSWPFKVILLLGFLVILIYLIGFSGRRNKQHPSLNFPMEGSDGDEEQPVSGLNNFTSKYSPFKHILLYSKFYDGDPNWYLGTDFVNSSYFENLRCPQTKCIVTSNRSALPGGIRAFDALLFFAHDATDMPRGEYPPPELRRPEQIFVVGMLETPPHTWRTFEGDQGMFNWTMSYRFESDVFWPYGYFVDRKTEKTISPSQQPIWREREEIDFNGTFFKNETLIELVKGKKKMAAWFVSNCALTPSKRMDVAEQMRKFLPVDIFGNCGNMTCPKNKHNECQLMLEKDYKFYLAFENSLCVDYITEKVFTNMNFFIIPVLYNGANNSRFLPPGSYLDVMDFGGIQDLTDHMKFLAENHDEYLKYFWWKEFYYIRVGYNFCDLCVKLHEHELVQRRQYYVDLDRWYRKGSCKKVPEIPLE